MTDLLKFQEFFDEMGVKFNVCEDVYEADGTELDEVWIEVPGVTFIFSNEGEYLMLRDGEIGEEHLKEEE